MLEFFNNMLSSEKGSISHKRVIASLGALCLYGCSIFKITIDPHLADLIFYLVCACMGLASVDKYTTK